MHSVLNSIRAIRVHEALASGSEDYNIPASVWQDMETAMRRSFDENRCTRLMLQTRELAGHLFSEDRQWEDELPCRCMWVDIDRLVFRPTLIDRVNDDLAACMKTVHLYGVSVDKARIVMDFADLTWKVLFSLVARGSASTMRVGALIWATIPTRVEEVVIYPPRSMRGFDMLMNAALSITSDKIRQRVVVQKNVQVCQDDTN